MPGNLFTSNNSITLRCKFLSVHNASNIQIKKRRTHRFKLVGDRWAKELGLDRLKYARVMSWDVFVFMASTVFPPELYDASIAWIQNSILIAISDDFFDDGGTIEELKNFIDLIER
jgi:hypothetical protein